MEKSSQLAWKIVPLRHFFPLKVVPLIEALLYRCYGSTSRLGGQSDYPGPPHCSAAAPAELGWWPDHSRQHPPWPTYAAAYPRCPCTRNEGYCRRKDGGLTILDSTRHVRHTPLHILVFPVRKIADIVGIWNAMRLVFA
jgi:hypothetical protein